MGKAVRGVGKVSEPRTEYVGLTGAHVRSPKSRTREEMDGYTATGAEVFRDG